MAGIKIKVDAPARNRIVLELAEKHVKTTADLIAAQARTIARPGKTGRVRANIKSEKNAANSRRVAYRVTAGDNHSILEHQGAKRHIIVPRRRGGMLRFYWEKIGEDVAFPAVNHPGMKGTKFLVKPLERIGKKRGYTISIVSGYIPVR